MRHILVFSFLLFISSVLFSQNNINTNYTTTKPWTYWWWPGSAVDHPGISYQLENFKKSGIGGAHIIPIYGVQGEEPSFIPFLSPAWVETFKYTLTEAKRLGIGIDLSTGTGWPFGGPAVPIDNSAKQMVFTQMDIGDTLNLKKLIQKSIYLEPDIFIINQEHKYEKISLDYILDHFDSAKSRKLVIITYEPTNQRVKRAAPGGEGLVIDHFDASSVKQYLSIFDSTLFKSSTALIPRSMYNDSYEVYNANWTIEFFRTFKKQHNYELRDRLFVLTSDYPDDLDKQKTMSDYRETLSSLLYSAERSWTDWARSHNMLTRYQAHGSPGNLLDLYALADIPETESFGSSKFSIPFVRVDDDYEEKRFGRPNPLIMKFASSPANLLGKKLVGSESTTWLGNHFKVSLSQIKPQLDEIFTSGINHLFFHGTTYSPPDEPFPGWLFYASTNYGINGHFYNEFPLLNFYIANCQKILQNSIPDNDLLLYMPIFDMWADTDAPVLNLFSVHHPEKWFTNTPFGKLATHLWETGYGFDYISDLQISQLHINSDSSVSIDKCHYRAIVIPKTVNIPFETIKNLNLLAKKGVKLIFDQSLPVSLPGNGRDYQIGAFNQSIHELILNRNVNIGSVDSALKSLNIRCETLVSKGLKYIRKRSGDETIWFLTNLSNKFSYDLIDLPQDGQSLEYYNPINNDYGKLHFTKNSHSMQTQLYLPPGSSCFLISSNHRSNKEYWNFKIPSENSLLIDNWEVKFSIGSPQLPDKIFHPSNPLTSWTLWPDSTLEWFNGYGNYYATFKLPENWKSSKGFYVQFNNLRETAKVTINNQDIGTIWSVPYQLYIPIDKFRFGTENSITLSVRNLSANEARFLDTKGVKWKKFYDANIVDITYKPFDASKWKPEASGILGSVKIVQVK